MSINSFVFKRMCTKSDKERDKNKIFPENIKAYRNIQYGEFGKSNLLDVYLPSEKNGDKLPVIVSVHGGGFVYGSRKVYQFYTASLAQRGFAVINCEYRLAPKNKFPTQLFDINEVFSWLLKNASEYGFDTNNVFAVGDSAGACLVSLYACALTNSSYAQKIGLSLPEGLNLKALGLNCGMYDTIEEQTTGSMRSFYPELCAQKGSKEELKLLSTIDFLTPSFPPSFIISANADMLLDRQPILTDALKAAGVTYKYVVYGDAQNSLGHVFFCNVGTKDADMANDDECAFFKDFI